MYHPVCIPVQHPVCIILGIPVQEEKAALESEAKTLIEFAAKLETQSSDLAANSAQLDALKVCVFVLCVCVCARLSCFSVLRILSQKCHLLRFCEAIAYSLCLVMYKHRFE